MSTKYQLKNLATGKSEELNAISGTMGPDVVDISNLHRDLGVFTYDPGFMATASTESKITYIDGDAGVLLYRGYPVEQLAEKSSFLEVANLLIYGTLPSKAQLDAFHHLIMRHTMVNEQVLRFFQGFHHDAHPIAIGFRPWSLRWPPFYHDTTDINDPRHREIFAHRIIAKLPTIARRGVQTYAPVSRSFIRAMTSATARICSICSSRYPANRTRSTRWLRMHSTCCSFCADHEQNASTSTVRLAGSTGANPYAAISAGVSALWGPAHGGANEAVLDMLDGIGSAAHIEQFLKRVKDKSDSVRLMGFGHRVYKNFDPRAKIIRGMCYRVLEKLGRTDNPMFELALKLEEIALKDEYFVSRRLYPNVDFYSGIIYSALGIPRSMFTVMFAIARTAGWVAHWQEMVSDPHMRIGRPRQLYTGPTKRDYLPIEKR